MKENTRAFAAGLDLRLPTGDELNLLGSGAAGIRPFAAFSTTIGRFDPHANLAYQWNGRSLLAGDVESQIEADLPDQFQYAIGTDLQVNSRFSIVFDVLGQRLMNASRLSTYEFQARASPDRSLCRTSASRPTGTGSPTARSGSRPTSRRACW